ncbi:M56 family metallopeptidase [Ekhidna sp.]|uniref:M56 family metallopeptidase n=1 Tax=Ekhidna sp. TaxID=2608089 RepID=UPI0032991C94
MIIYIVEFSILHLLFFGIYKLMLSQETQLKFLRFFLLGSTVLALIVPLLEIPAPSEAVFVNLATSVYPTFEINPTGSNFSSWSWIEIAALALSCLFALKFVSGIIQIAAYYNKSIEKHINGITVREIPKLETSFTFFQWIFIDSSHFENPEDIIQHELGHAKKLHILDMVFFHLLTIPFWWLPSIWLMIKELKKVHEFEADEFALKINDKTYAKTLVQCTLRAHGMNLASSFDDAPIFNRLNFMKKMKKKISTWKVASIAALVAISGAMFACEDELETEIKRIADESNQQIDYSADVKAALDELKQQNPNTEYVVVETSLDNEASIEKLNSYDPGQIAKIFVTKEGDHKRVVMIVSQDSDLFNKTVEVQESDPTNEVFTIVEKAASFPGGIDAFNEYISQNLSYPVQAQQLGVEGRVFIKFIVEKDGSLSNLEVVRGIGAGCDQAALDMMKNSPKWNPGEQRGHKIRQKLIQNILFKLPS